MSCRMNRYIGVNLEGSAEYRSFWAHGVWHETPSQHVDAFSTPKALQTPLFRILWRFRYIGTVD